LAISTIVLNNSQMIIETPRRRTARNMWLLLAALAALLMVVAWLRPLEGLFRRTATTHAGVGRQVPSVVLQPLAHADSPLDLAELKGSVVLLNIWGTWCHACREELPRLVKLADSHEGRDDFRLVTVSCAAGFTEDLDELDRSTSEYLAFAGLEAPAFADADGALRSGLQKLGVFNEMFPVTLLLDRQGVIRAVWDGHAPQQELERLVASLLVQR
jgi:thiol-disulfide isomerase/thioredoxin